MSRSKLSRILLIASFPTILVLFWDYLLNLQSTFDEYFFGSLIGQHNLYIDSHYVSRDASNLLACLLYPLFGLLADVRFGRYRVILFGIVLCFLSWIIKGIGFIVKTYCGFTGIFWALFGLSYFIQFVGHSSYIANIIQFNIDQFVGASADELSTLIYWHTAVTPIMYVILYLFLQPFKTDEIYLNLAIYIISGLSLSLVLVTHSFSKHKLEETHSTLINNPFKMIVEVLCYARKHKYPENRSALTYWEEEAPSRLDLGKEKYGGPFTEEEVENVKTTFRILPFFIAILGFVCNDNWSGSDFDATISRPLLSAGIGFNVSCILLFFLYQFFFRICFYKYMPNMLVRMGLGLFFALVVGALEMIIATATNGHLDSAISNNAWFIYIPQVFLGLSYLLVAQTSLEFIIAQSPMQMRGLMVGIWLSSWDIGYIFNDLLTIPFKCETEAVCSSMFYYLTKCLLGLFILVVFSILAKHYKYRVRSNEINFVQIVDEHYEKYIDQKEEFERERELLITSYIRYV